MNELITMNALTIANGYQFKSKTLAAHTKKIADIYSSAVKFADAKNREISSILSTIKAEKSYEADGFKSVSEYAEKIFGIKKQNAYALATAGDVYNDTKASAALKSFSPSKLAELSSVDRDKVEADIKAGTITNETTQKDLRSYAKAKAQEGKPIPAEVVTLYTCRPVGSILTQGGQDFAKEGHTLEEIDEYFTVYMHDNHNPARAAEVVKLPKCAAHTAPLAKKQNTQRRLYVTENAALVIELYTYAPNTKPANTPKFTKEELLAMLAAMEDGESENK